jgi:hypothetical protein
VTPQRRLSPTLAAGAAALACCTPALHAASPAGRAAASAPVIVAAGPRADPSDRPGGGLLRVTFSPDGNGRHDSVAVRVRSSPGDVVFLQVRPESLGGVFDLRARVAKNGVAELSWNGRAPGRPAFPDGSFVLKACSEVTTLCSQTRVVAHKRLLSIFSPIVTAATAGKSIPVVIRSDRPGPYTLDLVSVAHPRAHGVGSVLVPGPGRLEYEVPDVTGGVWLLRLRSGSVIRRFPIVVHEKRLTLYDPPSGTALVVYPYMTWRAYDPADEDRNGVEDTWYAHPHTPVVPLTGPYELVRRAAALAGREVAPLAQRAFARWFDEHGLTAQHVTDVELGRMPLGVLRRYATIVFPSHTEYYELSTYRRLLAYRNGGGRLYFMSGNSFYGQVRIEGSRIVRLSYRYRTATQSDFRIAVTGFRDCCWPRNIRPRYRLQPGVRARLPWLLQGTELGAGDLFGVAAGEVDAVDRRLSPAGTIVVASAVVPRFRPTHPILARGWIGSTPFFYEPARVKPRRVDIAYAATGRGEVFSWGSTGFLQTLTAKDVPKAERGQLDRVALNVWRRFTR